METLVREGYGLGQCYRCFSGGTDTWSVDTKDRLVPDISYMLSFWFPASQLYGNQVLNTQKSECLKTIKKSTKLNQLPRHFSWRDEFLHSKHSPGQWDLSFSLQLVSRELLVLSYHTALQLLLQLRLCQICRSQHPQTALVQTGLPRSQCYLFALTSTWK